MLIPVIAAIFRPRKLDVWQAVKMVLPGLVLATGSIHGGREERDNLL